MAPETRSRGVPPPSRVYNSSPALQQVQFPARRKKIRRYRGSERPSLKQQTLTQIDFVSSFGEDVQILSDSDGDVQDGGDLGPEDKENVKPSLPDEQDQNAQEVEGEEEEEEEEEVGEDDEDPLSMGRKRAAPSTKQSKKRRRTMGDDSQKAMTSRKEDKSRRKTLADIPPSSNYHTQTLTQFLGHRGGSFIADSDDDVEFDKDDGDDGDDGFLSWLGEPASPSAGRGKRDFSSPAMKRRHEAATTAAARGPDASLPCQDSVIPQTPAKRNASLRFHLSSGGLQSPSERMVGRYGAPDQEDSPLKIYSSPMQTPPVKLTGETQPASPVVTRQPLRVIEDSYTTDGCTTDGCTTDGCTTPSKSQTRISQGTRPTPARVAFDAPSKSRPVGYQDTPTKKRGLYEIPDSDEDDAGFDEETEHDGESIEERYGAGVETQLVLSELASTDENQDSCQDAVPCSSPSTQTSRLRTRAESVSATVQSTANQSIHTPTLRQPLAHLSSRAQLQSQPWESQRVPASILQSLPAPSARSDIVLPVSTASLQALVSGHTLHVTTPFKIPSQVVRFWLFENSLLRYMASVEPGQQVQPQPASSSPFSRTEWQFHATQVYELNNPVCENDMRQEGWLHGRIIRYKYLPPAVIGQLLWNLQHAIFIDHVPEQPQQAATSSPVHASSQRPRRDNNNPSATPRDSMTVSQQISAQIHSDMASSTQFPTSDDMVPSTPDLHEPLKLRSSSTSTSTTLPPKQPSRNVRASQATTLSQPSTPGKHTQQAANIPPPPPFNPSQSSVQFIETGSLSSLPVPSSLGSTSQLLTKSQLLPDSLIQDHAPPVQPEIWDSDDEHLSL